MFQTMIHCAPMVCNVSYKTEHKALGNNEIYILPVTNPMKILPVTFMRIQLFFYKFSKSNPIKPFLPVNFSGGFYK